MRIRGRFAVPVVLAAVAALVGSSSAGAALAPSRHGGGVRLNQIQVVGSHNSYHDEATPAEEYLRGLVDPEGEKALEYDHAPLRTQLRKQHVRQIELDVWADPEGGRYAEPLLRTVTQGGPLDPVMKQPGTKVFHIQEIDYHSNCLTLVRCLRAVKSWSDRTPDHLPVAIQIEFKDTPLPLEGLPAVFPDPLPWTTERMDGVDAEIRSVFRERDLITPDDVRGSAPTLESAVLTKGWPTLASSRGKVLFLMDNDGAYRTSYLAGHPSLAGRVLFTNSTPGQPDAAFVKENDPVTDQARIQSEVRAGYLVRTRADADTVQARTGDTTMRDAAFTSGAQYVSTDYPVASLSERFGTGYAVRIPGDRIARCTPVAPVNAPVRCSSARLPRR
jgi:calcium-dependent phosphoinositide phospholipase C